MGPEVKVIRGRRLYEASRRLLGFWCCRVKNHFPRLVRLKIEWDMVVVSALLPFRNIFWKSVTEFVALIRFSSYWVNPAQLADMLGSYSGFVKDRSCPSGPTPTWEEWLPSCWVDTAF